MKNIYFYYIYILCIYNYYIKEVVVKTNIDFSSFSCSYSYTSSKANRYFCFWLLLRFSSMVQLMRTTMEESPELQWQKGKNAAVKLEFEDALDEAYGPLSKRSKLSSSSLQVGSLLFCWFDFSADSVIVLCL